MTKHLMTAVLLLSLAATTLLPAQDLSLTSGGYEGAGSGRESAKFGLNTAENYWPPPKFCGRKKWSIVSSYFHFHIRFAGPGYFDDQEGRAGSGALLRQALQNGFCRSSPWTWAAVWGSIMTAAGRLSTARPIPPCRNTPTTLFFTSVRFASRSRCRIRRSSAKAGGPLSPITACWSWKHRQYRENRRPGGAFNMAKRSRRWCAIYWTSEKICPASTCWRLFTTLRTARRGAQHVHPRFAGFA